LIGLISFAFALVVEKGDKLYEPVRLTDEGYLVYNKLDADSTVVYNNAVTSNPYKIVDQDEYEYLSGLNSLETSTYWKRATIIAWLEDHGVEEDLDPYAKDYLQGLVSQIIGM
jgi:hypothetical protein